MNCDIRNEWIERLRSDEFVQITSQLANDGNGRCALGVLAEVCVDRGLARWEIREGEPRVLWYGEYCARGIIPYRLRGKIGLPDEEASVIPTMNDLDHAPFRKIADWVEKHIDCD